jgi:rubredoxin
MDYKKYQCSVCGYIYDEAKGDPEAGLAAGARWADIPEDWFCPDCGTAKSEFEMVEIA